MQQHPQGWREQKYGIGWRERGSHIQHVMSMMKKELMTGRMEAEMAVRIFWRERSRPNMRMACTQARGAFGAIEEESHGRQIVWL